MNFNRKTQKQNTETFNYCFNEMQANSTHLLLVVELSLLVFDELCMSLLVTACTVKRRVSVVAELGGGANRTQTEVYLHF